MATFDPRRLAFTLCVGLASLAIICRVQFTTGFSRLFGDRFDGFMATSIMQHWFNVVRNFSSWNTTFYFFPNADTLGYNDGFLAHGLIGAALQFVGFDLFVAADLATMTLKFLGFVAFYLMLRACFGCHWGWSTLGASLFTIANNLYLAMWHVQFAAFSFAPLVILLASLAIRAFQERETVRGMWRAAAAVTVYGVWLLTSFYSVWFFTFFGIVATAAYSLVGGWRDLLALGKQLITKPIGLSLLIGWTIACTIPFLWVYLPKARETGMHSIVWIQLSAINVSDIVNVGSYNILWGGVLTKLWTSLFGTSFDNPIRSTGFPPIFLIIALASVIMVLACPARCQRDRVLRAISLAVLLTWPFTFRFNQWTPWELIFSYVPGAGAIRVVARYQFFLTIPLIVLAMACLERLSLPPLLVAFLVCGLLVEELNTTRITGIHYTEELALLNRTPSPPLECKVFFVSRAREGDAAVDETTRVESHNIDANLISEAMRIPTINGFASFLPPHWSFDDPRSSDYLDNVKAYAARYKIEKLCALDLMNRQWEKSR